MLKVNLGCNHIHKEGYINCDISPDVGADMVFDIESGLPFEDGECEEIFAGCVLEQVHNFKEVLNDCHRALKPGGRLAGYVPSTDSSVFALDPEDRKFFQVKTFEYFDIDKHAWQHFGKTYGYLPWTMIQAEKNDNGIIHFSMRRV